MRISDWSSDVCSSDLLAWQAPDGRIHINGRSKELIIRSGFNVSPLEVETALNTHALVQYSAVLGHTKDGNEEIIAIIQLKASATICETELKSFLASRLSPYKRTTRIIFMDNIPVAPNGKLLKQQLMQKLGEMRSEEHTYELQSLMRISYAVF